MSKLIINALPKRHLTGMRKNVGTLKCQFSIFGNVSLKGLFSFPAGQQSVNQVNYNNVTTDLKSWKSEFETMSVNLVSKSKINHLVETPIGGTESNLVVVKKHLKHRHQPLIATVDLLNPLRAFIGTHLPHNDFSVQNDILGGIAHFTKDGHLQSPLVGTPQSLLTTSMPNLVIRTISSDCSTLPLEKQRLFLIGRNLVYIDTDQNEPHHIRLSGALFDSNDQLISPYVIQTNDKGGDNINDIEHSNNNSDTGIKIINSNWLCINIHTNTNINNEITKQVKCYDLKSFKYYPQDSDSVARLYFRCFTFPLGSEDDNETETLEEKLRHLN